MSNEVLEFVLARDKARANHERPRCYGVSSDALVLYALGQGPRPTVPGRPETENGGSWRGKECGFSYPHDEADLAACERSYDMAPPSLQAIMLPVLDEFRAWVREGRNRYGEQVPSRTGGVMFSGSGFEVRIGGVSE